MSSAIRRISLFVGMVTGTLLSACQRDEFSPTQPQTPDAVSFSIGRSVIGEFSTVSSTWDSCGDPPPPPEMTRGSFGGGTLVIGTSSSFESCAGSPYVPKWARIGQGAGGGAGIYEGPEAPLGSFVWNVRDNLPPADWYEQGFRKASLLSTWAPIVKVGPTSSLVGGGPTEDGDLLQDALEPLTPEEEDECPDCVLDAIALATDMLDVACNGMSFSRGVALVTDAAGLIIPGIPSPGGARLARRALVRHARTEGLAQHRAYKVQRLASGWIAERALPAKVIRAGEAPVRLRPDAMYIDEATQTVFIRELKPNTPSGLAAGRSQTADYQEVLRRVQSEDGGILRMNDADGNPMVKNISGYRIDAKVDTYEPPSFVCNLTAHIQ